MAVGPSLVLTLPGAPERRPEVVGVQEAAQQLLATSASVGGSSNGEERCKGRVRGELRRGWLQPCMLVGVLTLKGNKSRVCVGKLLGICWCWHVRRPGAASGCGKVGKWQ